MMADLAGQIGELRMVLEIKRKETGETEKAGQQEASHFGQLGTI